MQPLYVNGIFIKDGLTSTKIVHPSIELLGSSGDSNYGDFNGIIDEVRIYDHALGATDVIAEYNRLDPSAQVPEFPTIILPIAGVIGLMFLFQNRKGK
jgi:hypothetical protein